MVFVKIKVHLTNSNIKKSLSPLYLALCVVCAVFHVGGLPPADDSWPSMSVKEWGFRK